jgi:hypothetical protein
MACELAREVTEIVKADRFAGRGNVKIPLSEKLLRGDDPSLYDPSVERRAHHLRKHIG